MKLKSNQPKASAEQVVKDTQALEPKKRPPSKGWSCAVWWSRGE
jgi:hypothetical protein